MVILKFLNLEKRMRLNRTSLVGSFNGLQIRNGELVFDKNSLLEIKQKHYENHETPSHALILEKPYGIFAITDSFLNEYKITSFHYVDFRWFSEIMTAKIMHKANIEVWQEGTDSIKRFSESSFHNSGDVCGVMRGDFRDCFDAVIEKEKEHKLLIEGTMEFLVDDKPRKANFSSGMGLESLTILEKIAEDNKPVLSLRFIC